MSQSLKQQAVVGTAWSAIERFSIQGIQFILQILLARLLTPDDYGIIAMLAIFLQISQVFVDSGFANALIQKQDCSDADYSTIFFYNLAVSIGLYCLLFFTAPLIALFYKVPEITLVLRVLALTIIFNALSIVQKTILVKQINFKKQTIVTLISILLSGAIGFYLAYTGYGVWALVWQSLSNSCFLFIFYSSFVRWHPSFIFSRQSFNQLFGFGSKILVASLIGTVYQNLYTIVIGKKFSAQDLGFFSRASQFVVFPSTNIGSIINRVALPTLSKIQNDDEKLVMAYRKIICYASFIIFPIMVGLAVLATPLVTVVLTSKWLPLVPIMQVLCAAYIIDHLSILNLNLLYVKGRSDYVLRLEIIKKTIAIIILVATIPFGIIVMCYGLVFYNVIAVYINSFYTKKLINFGFFSQVLDVLPYLIISLIMGTAVYGTTFLISSPAIKLVLGIPVGIFVYVLLTGLFLNDIYRDILPMIRKRRKI